MGQQSPALCLSSSGPGSRTTSVTTLVLPPRAAVIPVALVVGVTKGAVLPVRAVSGAGGAAEVLVPAVLTQMGEGAHHLAARLVAPGQPRFVSRVATVRHVLGHVIEWHAAARQAALAPSAGHAVHGRHPRAVGGVDQAPQHLADIAGTSNRVRGFRFAVKVATDVRVVAFRFLAELVSSVQQTQVGRLQRGRAGAARGQTVEGAGPQLLQFAHHRLPGAPGEVPVARGRADVVRVHDEARRAVAVVVVAVVAGPKRVGYLVGYHLFKVKAEC